MDETKLYEYDYDKPELNETFLAHHQIKGAKWGIMHGPPYPLGSGQSTGSSLKKGAKPKSRHQLRVEARKKKKLNKQRVETLKRAREVKNQKNETKKRLLEKNDVKSIYENRNLFSEDEINKFISKYEADQKLKDLVNAEKSARNEKVLDKVKQIQKYADVGDKLVKNLSSFYDSYTSITNKMEEREAAQKKAQVEAYKKKITSDRDLKTAYDKRNLFSEDELKKLMSTVDTDSELRKRLETWNPEVTKVSGKRKTAAKQEDETQKQKTAAQRQIDSYKKKDDKVSSKLEKKMKFKNKAEYESFKEIVDRKKNQDYYFGNHNNEAKYQEVTDAEILAAKKAKVLSDNKAKEEAKKRKRDQTLRKLHLKR